MSTMIFFLGFLLYMCISFSIISPTSDYGFSYHQLTPSYTNVLFIDIFFNNLFLCLMLSIIGYLSGGLLTIILLFWNGYILGIPIKAASLTLSLSDILLYSIHIPLELFSLFAFATFGLKGFYFYKNILSKQGIKLPSAKDFKILILASCTLFIAAIIETL